MDKFSVIDNYEMENINGGSWLSIVGSVAAVVLTACPVPAVAACVGNLITRCSLGNG